MLYRVPFKRIIRNEKYWFSWEKQLSHNKWIIFGKSRINLKFNLITQLLNRISCFFRFGCFSETFSSINLFIHSSRLKLKIGKKNTGKHFSDITRTMKSLIIFSVFLSAFFISNLFIFLALKKQWEKFFFPVRWQWL